MAARKSRNKKKPIILQDLSDLFPLPQETLILIVVSALDVIMTFSLLTRGDDRFNESNPIARYFLDRWGMRGMAYFKGAMTLLVCVITQIVARKNELLAKRVLELATLIIVFVVIYSVSLHFRHHEIPAPVEIDAWLASTSVLWS
jgi:hypothetical protein